MNADTRNEILNLLTELKIDPENDADLARGYFILCLIKSLTKAEESYHVCVESPPFRKYLSDYEVDFFVPFDRLDEEVLNKIDSICSVFQSNNLYDIRTFFLCFSPWIVLDWSKFFEVFSTEKSNGLKLAALVFLLKCREKYVPEDTMFTMHPIELYQKYSDVESFWTTQLRLRAEQFDSCWNAIFFAKQDYIPAIKNGNIFNAINLYRKRFVSMKNLLSDFCDVNRYKKSIENALNPWAYVNKGIKNIPVEMGLSIDETLFEKAAYHLKGERPSDVIRAAFYPESRNDSAFECSFLFEEFASCMPKNYAQVLIVNPSPDFILKWSYDQRFSIFRTYFAVPDETVAMLYSAEFRYLKFVPFSEIAELNAMDRILIISRDYPLNKLDSLLSALSLGSDSAEILAVLPNVLFDSVQTMRNRLEESRCYIRDLVILSPTLTHSVPRKKVLTYIVKSTTPMPPMDISFFVADACAEKYSQQMYIRKQHWKVSRQEFFYHNYTVLSLLKAAELKKAGPIERASRDSAECYYFSEEIKILYTIQANRKNRYAGKAYYCAILREGERNRRHGKRLTEIIEKGLRAHTEHEVLCSIEMVAFDPRVTPFIVADICSFYAEKMDTLSLKTLWFCCRESLLKSRNYLEDMAMTFFCGERQELAKICPSMAQDSDFIENMELLFGEDSVVQIKYWRQLEQILDMAVRKKYLRFNPIASLVRSLSSQATEEQREVRNALGKKTFTLEEERKMLEFICTETKIPFGNRTAKRYEAESIWLAGAIRLFTGMAVREICALKWNDLVSIPGMDRYQFVITKLISRHGQVETKPTQTDWKKFRKVPVAPLLAEMLIQRKQYLQSLGNFSLEQLASMPIILKKELNEAQNSAKEFGFSKPRFVAEKCKKIVAAAEIPEHILFLPDEDNQVSTDIFKYEGDIFQTNFKYRANHTCALTRGEINYILGIEPPDTFSRNYCDYTNDFVQYGMGQKLQRWAAAHTVLEHSKAQGCLRTNHLSMRSTEVFGPFAKGVVSVDLIFDIDRSCSGGTLDIEVDCEFGFSGSVVLFGGDNDDA